MTTIEKDITAVHRCQAEGCKNEWYEMKSHLPGQRDDGLLPVRLQLELRYSGEKFDRYTCSIACAKSVLEEWQDQDHKYQLGVLEGEAKYAKAMMEETEWLSETERYARTLASILESVVMDLGHDINEEEIQSSLRRSLISAAEDL